MRVCTHISVKDSILISHPLKGVSKIFRRSAWLSLLSSFTHNREMRSTSNTFCIRFTPDSIRCGLTGTCTGCCISAGGDDFPVLASVHIKILLLMSETHSQTPLRKLTWVQTNHGGLHKAVPHHDSPYPYPIHLCCRRLQFSYKNG